MIKIIFLIFCQLKGYTLNSPWICHRLRMEEIVLPFETIVTVQTCFHIQYLTEKCIIVTQKCLIGMIYIFYTMFKNTIKNSQSDYSDTSHNFFSVNRLDTIFCFPAIFYTTFAMFRLDEFQFP